MSSQDDTEAASTNDIQCIGVDTASDESETAKATETPYHSRKPLWWKKLGRSKPTKSQQKAIRAMQSTHQLTRLGYGEFYVWTTVFGLTVNSACRPWLEIGCGAGENLLALAEGNPQQCFIGAEMHSSGIGTCFQRIYQATQRQRYWTDYTPYSVEREEECQSRQGVEDDEETLHINYNDESLYSAELTVPEGPYPHVRVFRGNGVKVLQASPNGTLDKVLITFPDPFPKSTSNRLLQRDVLDEIARALQPQGGQLVVASDHDGHTAWVREQVEQHRHDGGMWRQIPTTTELRTLYLPAVSKYEAKGWREGRTTKVLIYERISNNVVNEMSNGA